MIRVNRAAVPVPPSLTGAEVTAARVAVQAYFARSQGERVQQRFSFEPEVWWAPDVVSALAALFGAKCAFCETPLDPRESKDAEHFRPRANTKDPLRGTFHPEHYWWLAYEWSNLYAICRLCELNRAGQFPVRGPRASPDSGAQGLAAEDPLFLDPCIDRPHRFLDFREDGRVSPMGVNRAQYDRARVTIDVFGLNRSELVEARRQAARDTLGSVLAKGAENSIRFMHEMFEAGLLRLPYAAARIAAFGRILAARELGADDVRAFLRARGLKHTWVGLIPQWRSEGHQAWERAQDQADPYHRTGGPVYAFQSAYVTRVQIENFRAIRWLDLPLHPEGGALDENHGEAGDATRVGWTVLLGENGCAKSSVLQAIALALAGQVRADKWVRAVDVLRRPSAGEAPPTVGRVRVWTSHGGDPIEYRFDRTSFEFTPGQDNAGTFVRGYGSTRLLPPRAKHRQRRPEAIQIGNLFNPFLPLHHAQRWLLSLDAHQFGAVALALKDVLQLPLERDFRRTPSAVLFPHEDGTEVPLDQLSDGYQSMVALAVDIMAGLPAGESDYATYPGVVLLDELGTHLHPRWRMKVVESLRRAFSAMQFIATTHEPLCLCGLGDNEVALMRRGPEGIEVQTKDVPSPKGLRADQLLTSRLFGLHSTIDPRIDAKFQKYYALLASSEQEQAEEQREIDRLRKELAPLGVLGYTRRDQVVYDVIDQLLAEEQRRGRSMPGLSEKAQKRIQDIWDRVSTVGGGPR
jgi:uncharacterized protein (TIGR02646 family)